MAKRGMPNLGAIVSKKARTDENIASERPGGASSRKNPYLAQPVQPDAALSKFLTHARLAARRFLPKETKFPVSRPFCEVEARIGILKAPFGAHERRVVSSGPKSVQHNGSQVVVKAFDCTKANPRCAMESGVTRSHYVHWTQAGLSEISPISRALGITESTPDAANKLKRDLVEHEYVETVYAGYSDDRRVCFPGVHPPKAGGKSVVGKMEHKEKLVSMDLTIPAANYDLRISLATEKALDKHVPDQPPPGWNIKRIKRRRSYSRRDKSIAWQIDVTQVTTIYRDTSRDTEVAYEIEMELLENPMLHLVNENNDEKVDKLSKQWAQQLWWVLSQINTLSDTLDVEEMLRDHPNQRAVQLALAQCGAFKRFMDGGATKYDSPIGKSGEPSAALGNVKFVGCMPVNFSRHNIDEIQRSPDNAYFLSEKTDGVRYFMIFTGDTVVLVDRAMRGKQPIPVPGSDPKADPMASILPLVKPGTVFDGEVVMHRGRKPRPVFIVFDVLAISQQEPILHLPFEERLQHLKKATFRSANANRDMFDPAKVKDARVALPLVRKNFVKRTNLDELLSHVVEEKGERCYHNGDLHHHLTDGIIFQPNRPYICGTDHHLLKWKYLDTVTIDVEILPPRMNSHDDEDVLRVGVTGEENTRVDMTRYVHLPDSERRRLEADRAESNAKIAEVGFDPEVGEWYYLTMRPDKIAPNHISTVLGTLLELAESLTTEELRYRMSVPAGSRDTYRKDLRGMMRQLLEHQRRRIHSSR